MKFGPLVDAAWLHEHLGDPDVRVIDFRWYLQRRVGRDEYLHGHIPGAVFGALEDVTGEEGAGRHPLPTAEQFERAMRKAGVDQTTNVVADDDAGGSVAAGLWFLLGYFGHSAQAVLDGGLQAWGGPLETEVPTVQPGHFRAELAGAGRVLDFEEVRSLSGVPLIDARAGERYRGETEPVDPKAGHVPGALSAPFAKKLGPVPEILEMDVTKPDDIAQAFKETEKRWDRLDGLVHSVAFAPADALGGQFLNTPWESVATALQVSAFSFKEMARGFLPLMREHGGSMVTLDFDNSTSAWPKYDWMGVSKAALESVTRYLARDLGRYKIRVNAVCAGPLATLAASGIPGFKDFEEVWEKRAPLGWSLQDRSPVGRAVTVLLSDFLDMTTGELLHVDGGYHAMGTELPPSD